ncbi:fimbria/pilus outer membrane usher protein [Tahibacter harae]|uniref:Fimbria/pilus outer membrane usher protein n=1 Tax=Tahibacter harae TaxID=2963937 RepID=A0ABT1QP35_9GAMM|nr:fimbria/pilus outer membrane usher protein [Tahibacter harae]MCQ4163772.1 fimbria/pilus outer membrane usher protein [Tahibacter harae]
MLLEFGLVARAAAGADAGERLVYDVLLQGEATGKVEEFRHSGGALYAPRRLLQELGLAAPATAGEWVRLDSIDGLSASVDEAHQQLSLRLAAALRPLTMLHAAPDELPPPQRLAPGASLDYAINLLRGDGGDTDLAARLAPRLFGPYGSFSHDALYNSAEARRWRRIGTWWQSDFPQRPAQLRIGDALTQGPAWSRALYFGGVHWGSDYSLRPDLITYPLPAFAGQAAAPSTVDVIVNGLRTQHSETPDGPFAIPRLPVFTGGGEALVVVADALGREQVHRLPFFVSTRLLRAGLADYALDAGKLRRGYSDDYGDGFAAFAGRYGVSDELTVEAQLQAAAGLRIAGAGLVRRVGQLGSVQLAAGRSDGGGCKGTQWNFSTEWQRGLISLRSSHQWNDADYCDLAVRQGQPLPQRQAQLQLGLDSRIGQFNLSRIERDDAEGELHLDALSWSRRLHRQAWLSLGLQRVRESGRPDDDAILFSLLVPLGDGATAFALNGNAGGARERGYASLQRPPPAGPGFGYYLETALQRSEQRAGLHWRRSWADLSVEAEHTAGSNARRARIEGALAWMGGAVYASRQLGEAFAVVDAGPAVDVSIYRENQWLGRSDGRGRLLVPQLRAFETNRIALEPRELPPDVQPAQDRLLLRPYRGGGVLASFGVRRDTAQDWVLQLPDGRPAPPGSLLLIDGEARQSVGYGGLVHVEAATASARWELRGTFGQCRLVPVASTTWRCAELP